MHFHENFKDDVSFFVLEIIFFYVKIKLFVVLDSSLKSQQLELHFMELYHAKVEDSKYKAQKVEANSISGCTTLRNSCTLLLV